MILATHIDVLSAVWGGTIGFVFGLNVVLAVQHMARRKR